jgi:hypothetical protein
MNARNGNAPQGRKTMVSADERLVMYERRRMRANTLITLIGLVIAGFFFMNFMNAKAEGERKMQQMNSQFQIHGTECTGRCRLEQMLHDLTGSSVTCSNAPSGK